MNTLTLILSLIPIFLNQESSKIDISRIDLNTIKKTCTYHIKSGKKMNKLIYDSRGGGKIVLLEGNRKVLELNHYKGDVMLLKGSDRINLSSNKGQSIDQHISSHALALLQLNLFDSAFGPKALNIEYKDKAIDSTWGPKQASIFKKITEYFFGCNNTQTCTCELQTITRSCGCDKTLYCQDRETNVCRQTPEGTVCSMEIRCFGLCG